VPVAAVFGLEEDFRSLQLLNQAIYKHFQKKNVNCPAFKTSPANLNPMVPRDAQKHSWAVEHIDNFMYPPEFEDFMVALVRDNADDTTLLQLMPPPKPIQPTLHCDGAAAFAKLCEEIDWARTSCAKHLEAKVASCDRDLKGGIKTLLYEKLMSATMAEALRDDIIKKADEKPISSKTRTRIKDMFLSDEGMQQNCQAFRNFVFSGAYCADTVLETLFRHLKGDQRYCNL
jgi:hypothetical protein